MELTAAGFVFGGVACMSAGFLTHPVDTVKVRLQLQTPPHLHTTQPSTFLSGALQIVRQEGLRGLYRGVGASLLREGIYSTIRMGLYEPFKHMLATPGESHDLLWKKIVAGGLAGMCGSAVSNPTDLIKVRMQAQAHQKPLPSVIQVATDIIKREGIRGLYRGVGPNTQRAILISASQLPTYDHSKRILLESTCLHEGTLIHLICSMVAALVTATTTSPIDVVKSRFMNQCPVTTTTTTTTTTTGIRSSTHTQLHFYNSPFDCLRKTVQSEGIGALYKGWLPSVLRMGPHTIITFVMLEALRSVAGMDPF